MGTYNDIWIQLKIHRLFEDEIKKKEQTGLEDTSENIPHFMFCNRYFIYYNLLKRLLKKI